VTYEAVDSRQLREGMTVKGVPPPIVEMSVALGEAVRAGEFDAGSNDLARLMGRTPMTLEQFLALALARKEA
jgi:hypothetical protein